MADYEELTNEGCYKSILPAIVSFNHSAIVLLLHKYIVNVITNDSVINLVKKAYDIFSLHSLPH